MGSWEPVPSDGTLEDFTEAEVEEYLTDIYADLSTASRERALHNRDGFLAFPAGSRRCRELGHLPDPKHGWSNDEHPASWDGYPLCAATSYGDACTECESEDCDGAEYLRMSTADEFWALMQLEPSTTELTALTPATA